MQTQQKKHPRTYQHCDEVIEAARVLKQELIDDAPYGNTDAAHQWVFETYPQVCALAAQTTEPEAERAGFPL